MLPTILNFKIQINIEQLRGINCYIKNLVQGNIIKTTKTNYICQV